MKEENGVAWLELHRDETKGISHPRSQVTGPTPKISNIALWPAAAEERGRTGSDPLEMRRWGIEDVEAESCERHSHDCAAVAGLTCGGNR